MRVSRCFSRPVRGRPEMDELLLRRTCACEKMLVIRRGVTRGVREEVEAVGAEATSSFLVGVAVGVGSVCSTVQNATELQR